MELNKTLQKAKDLMESDKYIKTNVAMQSYLFHTDDMFGDGEGLKQAIQDQLKLITCEEDFNFLNDVMREGGYGHTMWTKRTGRHILSVSPYGYRAFMQENGQSRWEVVIDPKYCQYIADGDNNRRKCQWKNLWRNVEISA